MTTVSTLDPPSSPDLPVSLEEHLEAARDRIQVEDDELDEARRRRDLIAAALRGEFPGSEIYVNGSVAHGDALTPLTDIDIGVIVADADDHGPGKKGCSDLQERAANAVREALRSEFPEVSTSWRQRHRSVLVQFRKPVDPSQDDFTADVIVAINNPDDEGLFIPNYLGWDRSHPQEHTRLVRESNKISLRTFARVVRLLKHWNRMNGAPLCSWNIKALALAVLVRPTRLLDGMLTWFDHAIDSLDDGLTEDPAGVAEKPIKINKDMTLRQVVDQLDEARDQLRDAARLERQGWPLQAQEKLAKFFNDELMMPMPDPGRLHEEFLRRLRSVNSTTGASAAGAGLAVTTSSRPVETPNVRSWSPGA